MKKEISMRVRKVISKEVAKRYQKARKKEKSKILDEFVELTGYNRKYGSWLLRNWGREVVVWSGSKRIVFIGDIKKRKKRQGRRIYGKEVEEVLKKIWYILDFPCGRRLADYMGEILPKWEKCCEIEINPEVREKLLKISGRTIDRILREEKKKWRIKGKKGTKPGSLLKSQIPVRTFADWNEKVPGFIEIDLVEHSEGVAPVREDLWRKGDIIHRHLMQHPPNNVSDPPCFVAEMYLLDGQKRYVWRINHR